MRLSLHQSRIARIRCWLPESFPRAVSMMLDITPAMQP